MIISASRRTDIPAFFSEWFMQNLRKGYLQVANPFNYRQVVNVSLKKEDVDVIVFWTKNPAPFLKQLDDLDEMGYRYIFHFTLNDYPKILEPNLPELSERIQIFKVLSNRIGPERLILRYDPIILSDEYNYEYHEKAFEKIIKQLRYSTKIVIISLLAEYKSVVKRLSRLKIHQSRELLSESSLREFAKHLAQISKCYGLEIQSCALEIDLSKEGIKKGACIDLDYLNQIFDLKMSFPKDPGQRKNCGCALSKDIGKYNSCLHKCAYCYANKS